MTEALDLLLVAGRTALIYGVVLVLLRLIGQRQIGQTTPSDLVVLLLVSEAVQNAMLGGDETLAGGIVSMVTLLLIGWLIEQLTLRFPRLERWIEGSPQVVVEQGRIDRRAVRAQKISEDDLIAALRSHGLASLDEASMVVIESNGRVSVLKRPPDPRFNPRRE